jgi:uncharacterized protein
MTHLLDVSFLLACGWGSHSKHAAARAWLERQRAFAINPFTELGFLRVSMTPGYHASFTDAQAALADITSRKQARWLAADLRVAQLPPVAGHADVTDAYLVGLARSRGLKLATLDDELCKKPWAVDTAENPL